MWILIVTTMGDTFSLVNLSVHGSEIFGCVLLFYCAVWRLIFHQWSQLHC